MTTAGRRRRSSALRFVPLGLLVSGLLAAGRGEAGQWIVVAVDNSRAGQATWDLQTETVSQLLKTQREPERVRIGWSTPQGEGTARLLALDGGDKTRGVAALGSIQPAGEAAWQRLYQEALEHLGSVVRPGSLVWLVGESSPVPAAFNGPGRRWRRALHVIHLTRPAGGTASAWRQVANASGGSYRPAADGPQLAQALRLTAQVARGLPASRLLVSLDPADAEAVWYRLFASGREGVDSGSAAFLWGLSGAPTLLPAGRYDIELTLPRRTVSDRNLVLRAGRELEVVFPVP